MRTLFASALVLLACGVAGGCADRSSRPSGAEAAPTIPGGPDPLVLRLSRDGGTLTAARYPVLDTTVWRSATRVPPLTQVIGFGPEDGYLAAVDSGGSPVRIDLRLGSVTTSRTDTVRSLVSADGGAIYGLTQSGEVTRYTPSGGDWRYRPSNPVDALFAPLDGSVILVSASEGEVMVRRVRPPNQAVSDSVSIKASGDLEVVRRSIGATAGTVGDRLYFAADERVIAVRTRDLGVALNVDLGDPITAIAATPSGDRLFVALEDESVLRIVDRFEEGVTGRIRLPAPASALRMDPMGRMLLARGTGDSVYVVSLGGDAVLGVVQSAWRGDLPLVMADGSIAITRGDDVVLAHPSTLSDMRTIAGGAKQFWHTLRWNGLRPRAAGLDQPVQFRNSAPRDTAPPPAAAPTGPDSTRATRGDSAGAPAAPSTFTVSFAALLDERQARALAGRIRVEGLVPRITTTDRDGTTVYRVVLGPFPSRAEADRVGKLSGQNYWVFEGAP
ncbi:MAG TPA: SPOR domain-containing protein [Gemmatimonas sp.]|uniref:SPOR domain-containing protein n=1 Tax=Gemmatimonas sp. TaxID=1962908 RepID=UPI002ED9699C